jgi:hypothetical protein
MSIERIFHCDGPDCGTSVRTRGLRPDSYLITATETGGGPALTRHFCSWDCTMRYAAAQPAMIEVPAEID